LLKRGDSGSYVTQLQGLLSVEPQSGYFGPLTEAAVVALQKREGLPQSGTTTPPTWAAARAGKGSVTPTPSEQPVVAGRALPSRMTYRVRSGDSLSAIAKKWRSTVAAIRSASRLDSDVIQVGQRLVVPVRSSITKFTWTTLRKGDTGVAVKALQTALRMKPKYRTGYFGPKTKRKVKKLKAARGWRVNGRAGPGVWRALGA
jgi:peptidoglycan hydrolase-like protein with peptidoglycan-binding domain